MFDISQLDDRNAVLAAAGITEKRKRQESLSDPNFQNTYSSQISDFNKGTNDFGDYMGAGRLLAQNQDVNPDIANLFSGSLKKHGNEWYSYAGEGNPDPSTAVLFDYKNPGNYKVEDLGLGKYNIFDQGGTNLGMGFKSLDDTIRDLSLNDAKKHFVNTPIESFNLLSSGIFNTSEKIDNWTYQPNSNLQQFGVPTEDQPQLPGFKTQDELINYLDSQGMFRLDSQEKYGRPITDLQRWETIGDYLNPSSSLKLSMLGNNGGVQDWTYHRDFGGNEKSDLVKGLDNLYGSGSVLLGNKLYGNILDMEPLNPGDAGYRNPVTMYASDPKGDTKSSSLIQRQYNPGWENYIAGIGDGKGFVKPEDFEELPGWLNADSHSYSHQSSGFIPKLFSKLAPIAPFLNFIPGWGTIAASIIGGVNAVNNDNPLGLAMSALGGLSSTGALGDLGGLDFSAADAAQLSQQGLGASQISDILQQTYGSGMTTSLAQTIGDLSSSLNISPQNLIQGGMSALTNGVANGGTSGLIAGLSSIFGGELGQATGSKGFGKVGSTAASFGLNSLFNKNNQTPGSSSLESYTNTVPMNQGQEIVTDEDRNKRFTLNNIYRQANRLNG